MVLLGGKKGCLRSKNGDFLVLDEIISGFGLVRPGLLDRSISGYDYPLDTGSATRTFLINKSIQKLNSSEFPSTSIAPEEEREDFSYGAIAAEIGIEIAKALTPGADGIDVFIEFFWKPLVENESPDTVIGIISVIGLSADLGYLTPVSAGASAVVNYLAGAIRAGIKITKRIPGGADFLVLLFKSKDSMVKSANLVMDYFYKAYQASGSSSFVDATVKVIDQYQALVQSVLDIGADASVKTVNMIAEKSGKFFTDNAAKGMGRAIKARNGVTTGTEALFRVGTNGAREYSDDVVEAAFDVIGKSRAGGVVIDLAYFSDEAIEGVAKLIKNADNSVASAKGVADKLLEIGTQDADKIFKKINDWADTNTALTGTVAEACQSVKKLVDHTSFGAVAVKESVEELGENSAQGYLRSLGKALDDATDGAKRAQDSLTALKSTPATGGANDVISNNLSDFSSMKEFHGMRNLDPSTLTTAQKTEISMLRDMIPGPTNGEILQRNIPEGQISSYLDGTFDQVGGFFSKQVDIDDLTSVADKYNGLRLDYPGTNFSPSSKMGQFEIPYDNSLNYSIPRKPVVTDPHPFTGNGFLGNTDGVVRPEYKFTGFLDAPNGSKFYEIGVSGTKEKFGEVIGGRWVFKDGSDLYEIQSNGSRRVIGEILNGNWVIE